MNRNITSLTVLAVYSLKTGPLKQKLNVLPKSSTPLKTHRTSALKSQVLKKHFWLKNDGEK